MKIYSTIPSTKLGSVPPHPLSKKISASAKDRTWNLPTRAVDRSTNWITETHCYDSRIEVVRFRFSPAHTYSPSHVPDLSIHLLYDVARVTLSRNERAGGGEANMCAGESECDDLLEASTARVGGSRFDPWPRHSFFLFFISQPIQFSFDLFSIWQRGAQFLKGIFSHFQKLHFI